MINFRKEVKPKEEKVLFKLLPNDAPAPHFTIPLKRKYNVFDIIFDP